MVSISSKPICITGFGHVVVKSFHDENWRTMASPARANGYHWGEKTPNKTIPGMRFTRPRFNPLFFAYSARCLLGVWFHSGKVRTLAGALLPATFRVASLLITAKSIYRWFVFYRRQRFPTMARSRTSHRSALMRWTATHLAHKGNLAASGLTFDNIGFTTWVFDLLKLLTLTPDRHFSRTGSIGSKSKVAADIPGKGSLDRLRIRLR